MRWSSLLFAHWPVPAAAIRPLVPPALEVDTFDGTAWVGLVPFTMPLFRPRAIPRWVPRLGLGRFHECNVRTYVTREGEAGVWFFSLDASARLAVWGARTFWSLPYFRARIDLVDDGDLRRYSLDRTDRRAPAAGLRCRWQVGAPLPASSPGDLAHFLTERYQLYAVHRGRLHRGRIHHDPWPLREARCLELADTLVAAAGIHVEGDPVLHAADPIEVEAFPLEPVN